jgi:gliding motility-associated lipoprotein GldJ
MNIRFFVLALSLCMMSSCFLKKKGGGDERSSATGWKYNDTEWGGFEKLDYEGQLNAPNMVLIPGGTFTMGQTGQDVVYDWNNIARRVSVTSFYMDETEVSNINWREYVYWLETRYESHPQVAQEALPDEKVWYYELSYNDPLVETYFKHPAYDDYPVVGVTWSKLRDTVSGELIVLMSLSSSKEAYSTLHQIKKIQTYLTQMLT